MLARALALAALLILARTLAADELGALLSALAAGVLGAALATGGLADATARHAAATPDGSAFGRGDLARALKRFGVALPFVLAAVIVIAARSSGDIGTSGIVAAAVLATTQGATTIAASVFRARNQPGRFALATNLAGSAGRVVLAALALLFDLSGESVLWAFALLNGAVAAVTWRYAVKGLALTANAAPGVGALQLGGVVWGLLGNLDVVVVGLLLGAGPAGVYSVALRVAEFGAQFLVAISLFFLPEATRLAVTGHRQALQALYRAACRWSAFTTLLATGVGFILAPEIAQIVLPDDVDITTTLLRILFAGYAVHGALGVSYATLSAMASYGAIWRSAVVSLPLLVAGTVVFTQIWGLTGAACSTLCAYVGLNAWWTLRTAGDLGVTPFDTRYGRSVAASVLGWLATGLAAIALDSAGAPATLVIAGAAGVTVGGICLLLFGVLSPTEREELAAALGGRARGSRPDEASRPVSRG